MSARKRHLRNARTVISIGGITRTQDKGPVISFSAEDFSGTVREGDDPMVISTITANFILKRVLIDQGSSADILYGDAFRKLGLSTSQLKPFATDLVGFTGNRIGVQGYIDLPTTFGEALFKIINIRYLVVDCPSAPYNAILGRPSLNALGAIVSTPHLAMKFIGTGDQVITIKADQVEARRCYNESLKKAEDAEQHIVGKRVGRDRINMTDFDPRIGRPGGRPEPDGDIVPI